MFCSIMHVEGGEVWINLVINLDYSNFNLKY